MGGICVLRGGGHGGAERVVSDAVSDPLRHIADPFIKHLKVVHTDSVVNHRDQTSNHPVSKPPALPPDLS